VSQNVAVLQKVIGDAQAAIVGGQLPESLTVQVFDRLGNPIDGAIVRFEATQGGGSVGAPSVFTTAAGRAATTWTLGMTPGAQQATASASVIQFVGDSMPSGDSVVSVTFGATAAALSFADIGAGAYHTCGRTTAGAAFCWGYGGFGQIGNGSMSETPTPQAAAAGLTFDTVSVGGIHTCGLTAGGAAYCWGSDAFGSLGAGAPGPETCIGSDAQAPCSARPLAVAGGLAFVSISTAWGPTCGLTADGSAYCWGDDSYGQLGIGVDTAALVPCTFGPCSRTPLAVAGSLTFTSVGTGILHTCGLTTSGAAYCWGSNIVGQLGIGSDTAPDLCAGGGTTPCSRTPLPVAGGLTFTRLRVGYAHTCGLATDAAWYCWGLNNYGQVGNDTAGPEMCRGTYPCSTVPVAVVAVGGASFATVFPGPGKSCGVTAGGVAYCWGFNESGQLGDGTTISSRTPVAVAGGLIFGSVSPYLDHTCGVTTGSVAYCWGSNNSGRLGDGTSTSSSVPVPVAGQVGPATTAAIRSGVGHRSSLTRMQGRPVP